MTNKSNTTLDSWLVKKEEASDHQENKISLTSFLEEFSRNIRIPELKDTEKIVYKIFDIFPEKSNALLVTEKARVASAIAKALGGGKKKTIRTPWGNVVSFEVTISDRRIVIIPLRGHVTDYDVVDEYSGDWRNSDPASLINPDSLRIVIKEKSIVSAIKKVASNSNLLILATDADEEGANIGLEVFDIVREVNKNIKAVQMWFISLDRRELRNAFLTPIEPKWSWANAVKARRIIDAMIGFSATRELTVKLWNIVKKTGITRVFSIGRVQTPTLYIVYIREREIESFKPKPYWVLYVDIDIDGKTIRAVHEQSPFYSLAKAQEIYEKIRKADTLKITSLNAEKKRIRPPSPLNTTKALILLNEILGLGSKEAMKILEDLYLNGLITYPRTETDKYPSNYSHEKNLRSLLSYEPLKNLIGNIIKEGSRLRRNGSKLVGDHLPITPIATPSPSTSLSKKHLSVYDVIIRRYLALFMHDAEVSKIHLRGEISREPFKVTLTKISREGFFIVYPYNRPREDLVEKEIEIGSNLPIKKVSELEKKFTQPPPRLTEGTLISIMERLGLGTKSTRPDHIETLISRGYIFRRGKTLYITKLGYSIISFLEKIWPDFVKPYFSAKVHIFMRKVMNREMDWREMIEAIKNEYLELFNELRGRIKDASAEIESAVMTDISEKKVFECPKCGAPMIIKATRSPKINLLYCISCGYSLIIPTARSYKQINIKCAICGSNILALRRKHRTIYLCPVCWKQYGPCYKCPKKDQCDVSDLLRKEREKYIVGKCTCGGNLLYYPEYRLVRCDKCGKKYYLPKKGSIVLLKKRCEKHDLRLFSIRMKSKRIYYCIACNETS